GGDFTRERTAARHAGKVHRNGGHAPERSPPPAREPTFAGIEDYDNLKNGRPFLSPSRGRDGTMRGQRADESTFPNGARRDPRAELGSFHGLLVVLERRPDVRRRHGPAGRAMRR